VTERFQPATDSELAEAIRRRATSCGVELLPEAVTALTRHARAVLEADPQLHLTTIVEPGEFVERMIGEGLDGAAMIDPAARGLMIDLGSGNGYPGLPVAAARPGLELLLVEASQKKSAFLRQKVCACIDRCDVLERQVQRAADLEQLSPLRLVVTRAMGNWERVLPRLAERLSADGEVLLWAGAKTEQITNRRAWRDRLRLIERRALPQRERSWVWRFAPAK